MVLSFMLLSTDPHWDIGLHMYLAVSCFEDILSFILNFVKLEFKCITRIYFSLHICLFRGLWGAFDEWTDDLVPVHDSSGMANPENYLVTALIAMVVLIALGCFNTPSSRGVRNLQVTYCY